MEIIFKIILVLVLIFFSSVEIFKLEKKCWEIVHLTLALVEMELFHSCSLCSRFRFAPHSESFGYGPEWNGKFIHGKDISRENRIAGNVKVQNSVAKKINTDFLGRSQMPSVEGR